MYCWFCYGDEICELIRDSGQGVLDGCFQEETGRERGCGVTAWKCKEKKS
jgi:hypothetical protein